jgi:hypothetical protein
LIVPPGVRLTVIVSLALFPRTVSTPLLNDVLANRRRFSSHSTSRILVRRALSRTEAAGALGAANRYQNMVLFLE